MFDMTVALNIHRIKCEDVIRDSLEAQNSDDVDFAYVEWCEAEGMVQILCQSCGRCLSAISLSAEKMHSDAWAAWNAANNKINYDPETGNPRRI